MKNPSLVEIQISGEKKTPRVGEGVFLADTSRVIGDVTLGDRCSIWYSAVIRGDVMPIVLGDEVNIQDGAVLHGTFKKAGTTIGRRTTVGHTAILHGCTIGEHCLIGMGAIVMDGVQVGNESIIGAGALVTEGSVIPPRSLVLGRPGKVVRPLTPEEIKFLSQSADNYLLYKSWY